MLNWPQIFGSHFRIKTILEELFQAKSINVLNMPKKSDDLRSFPVAFRAVSNDFSGV